MLQMYSITVRTLATAQYLAEYVIGTRDRHGVRIEEVCDGDDKSGRDSCFAHSLVDQTNKRVCKSRKAAYFSG